MRVEQKYWVTADWHLGHQNIIRFCNRPENFEELIFHNLFNLVLPSDVLIHLGDVALKGAERMHRQYVMPISCKKWLIRGNHDAKSDTWYLNHGWDFVCKALVISKYGKQIAFSHEPLNDFGYDLNIHGHIHNNPGYTPGDKQVIVSIEDNKYKPILLEALAKEGDANHNSQTSN